MMKTLLVVLSFFITFEATAQHNEISKKEDETTFIFTRHAEKMKSDDSDPSLNEEGQKRADKLLRLLGQYETIDAVYSTDYKRTRETAQPVAVYFQIPVKIYNPRELESFKNQLLAKHHSEVVLIVGHSNTTPALINLVMGQDRVEQIDESDYSNMYVITIDGDKLPILKHYVY